MTFSPPLSSRAMAAPVHMSDAGEEEEEEETWFETKLYDALELWDGFRYFMYNPLTGRIMGRTRKSLGEI